MYPTISELERGVIPGAGPLVVDTEFGRVGFAICYDLNFPDLRLGYRDLHPDVILFGSAFRGGLQTQWWGYETRSYMISSCIDPRSVIVNPVGRVVAQTDAWARTLTHTINLDYEVVHFDYSNKRLDEARRRFGKAVEFEWAEPEGVMLLTSHGSTSVRDLVGELGWQKVEDYFAESRHKRGLVLAGEKIASRPAPW
jgi:predicted amidohydrolase